MQPQAYIGLICSVTVSPTSSQHMQVGKVDYCGLVYCIIIIEVNKPKHHNPPASYLQWKVLPMLYIPSSVVSVLHNDWRHFQAYLVTPSFFPI